MVGSVPVIHNLKVLTWPEKFQQAHVEEAPGRKACGLHRDRRNMHQLCTFVNNEYQVRHVATLLLEIAIIE